MFNVIDRFRQWTVDEIKNDLNQRRNNFSICITNEFHDMNIGTIIRSANAFLAKEVIIYGKKQYDRRGTVGTHHYENISFVREIESLNFDGYVVIGVDNIPGSTCINEFKFDPNVKYMFCFGQETAGLCDEIKALCHHIVYIKQYGSVRSLNVGCAASILMYEYTKCVA